MDIPISNPSHPNKAEMSKILVKFVTSQQEYKVPEAPIHVPTACKRNALSDVINTFLGKSVSSDDRVNFDFLIDGILLRGSIDTYLTDRNLSSENTLVIEYIVALPPPKPVSSFQADDWIASISIVRSDRIVSAGYDGVVRLWDRDGVTLVKHQLGLAPLKTMVHLQTNNDGDIRIAAAGMSQKVSVVELGHDNQSEILCELIGNQGTIESITTATNSSHLYTAGWDASIRVYSVSDKSISESTATLPPPSKKIKSGTKPKAQVAQIASLGTMTGHVGAINTLAAGSENILYSGGNDHSIREWDLSTHTPLLSMSCEKLVRSISYSTNHQLLASSHADPVIRIWDPRSNDATLVQSRLLGHVNQVTGVAWCESSRFHLASASLDGSVRVFDIRSPNQSLHTIQVPLRMPTGGAADDENRHAVIKDHIAKRFCVSWKFGLVASGGEDCQLNVWEDGMI